MKSRPQRNLGPCCFCPVQTWFKHFDHFWGQNCPISDFRRVADLHRWKFVFEWWFSDYSTSKTLKNLFKSFFKQRIYRIHFWEIEFILANPHIGRFKQFIGWLVGRCLCNHLEADWSSRTNWPTPSDWNWPPQSRQIIGTNRGVKSRTRWAFLDVSGSDEEESVYSDE